MNGFQTTNPDTVGQEAGYVLTVAGDHSSLLYSTFLGGSGSFGGTGPFPCGETLTRIAVDSSGKAYITGSTCSLDYPLVNAFEKSSTGFGQRDVGLQD